MTMTLNRHILFIVAAVVCFLIALLLGLNVFSGGNEQAWVDGGLLSLAASFLP